MKALQSLSEMFYEKYKNEKFRTTLRGLEALWVKEEQKEKFSKLYKDLENLTRP